MMLLLLDATLVLSLIIQSPPVDAKMMPSLLILLCYMIRMAREEIKRRGVLVISRTQWLYKKLGMRIR